MNYNLLFNQDFCSDHCFDYILYLRLKSYEDPATKIIKIPPIQELARLIACSCRQTVYNKLKKLENYNIISKIETGTYYFTETENSNNKYIEVPSIFLDNPTQYSNLAIKIYIHLKAKDMDNIPTMSYVINNILLLDSHTSSTFANIKAAISILQNLHLDAEIVNNSKSKINSTAIPGVYCLKYEGQVFYIGSSKNIRKRFTQHRDHFKNTSSRMYLYRYAKEQKFDIEKIEYIIIFKTEDYRELESKLINLFKPPANILV